jgi:hypothetical protein
MLVEFFNAYGKSPSTPVDFFLLDQIEPSDNDHDPMMAECDPGIRRGAIHPTRRLEPLFLGVRPPSGFTKFL